MRAYLSILLVPELEGGGAGAALMPDDFAAAPEVFTEVWICSSLDPSKWWMDGEPVEAWWGVYPVKTGVEGGAEGVALAEAKVSAKLIRLKGFGLEADGDRGVTSEGPWVTVEHGTELFPASSLFTVSASGCTEAFVLFLTLEFESVLCRVEGRTSVIWQSKAGTETLQSSAECRHDNDF